MIFYNIENIDKAKKLVGICENYEDDIDVIYGRQIIDGKSILGVMSLIGKMVSLKINTNNQENKIKFEGEIENEI